eukprot:GHVP01026761.1.p1 GENE.GHVP01026761.1~~GHVP01026761.1.p1  ORF type:complete len:534 (+),score=59.71 GHVP01026761.1:58-1602(+)
MGFSLVPSIIFDPNDSGVPFQDALGRSLDTKLCKLTEWPKGEMGIGTANSPMYAIQYFPGRVAIGPHAALLGCNQKSHGELRCQFEATKGEDLSPHVDADGDDVDEGWAGEVCHQVYVIKDVNFERPIYIVIKAYANAPDGTGFPVFESENDSLPKETMSPCPGFEDSWIGLKASGGSGFTPDDPAYGIIIQDGEGGGDVVKTPNYDLCGSQFVLKNEFDRLYLVIGAVDLYDEPTVSISLNLCASLRCWQDKCSPDNRTCSMDFEETDLPNFVPPTSTPSTTTSITTTKDIEIDPSDDPSDKTSDSPGVTDTTENPDVSDTTTIPYDWDEVQVYPWFFHSCQGIPCLFDYNSISDCGWKDQPCSALVGGDTPLADVASKEPHLELVLTSPLSNETSLHVLVVGVKRSEPNGVHVMPIGYGKLCPSSCKQECSSVANKCDNYDSATVCFCGSTQNCLSFDWSTVHTSNTGLTVDMECSNPGLCSAYGLSAEASTSGDAYFSGLSLSSLLLFLVF